MSYYCCCLIKSNGKFCREALTVETINNQHFEPRFFFFWEVLFKYWRQCCWACIGSRHPRTTFHDILWGHDVMGIPESNGIRFDLMHAIFTDWCRIKSHFCMDDCYLLTPLRRRLCRTLIGLGRLIPSCLALNLEKKRRSSDWSLSTSRPI